MFKEILLAIRRDLIPNKIEDFMEEISSYCQWTHNTYVYRRDAVEVYWLPYRQAICMSLNEIDWHRYYRFENLTYNVAQLSKPDFSKFEYELWPNRCHMKIYGTEFFAESLPLKTLVDACRFTTNTKTPTSAMYDLSCLMGCTKDPEQHALIQTYMNLCVYNDFEFIHLDSTPPIGKKC